MQNVIVIGVVVLVILKNKRQGKTGKDRKPFSGQKQRRLLCKRLDHVDGFGQKSQSPFDDVHCNEAHSTKKRFQWQIPSGKGSKKLV